MRNRSAASIKNPSTRFSRLIFLFYSLLQLWNRPLSKHIEKRERKFYRIFLIETSNYFEKKKKEEKIKIRERNKERNGRKFFRVEKETLHGQGISIFISSDSVGKILSRRIYILISRPRIKRKLAERIPQIG